MSHVRRSDCWPRQSPPRREPAYGSRQVPDTTTSWRGRVRRPSGLPTTRTGSSGGADLPQDFLEVGVFRLQTPLHGHVFRRVLAKEYQRVSDVVSLVDGSGDLLHQLPLGVRAKARRGLDKDNRHRRSSPAATGRAALIRQNVPSRTAGAGEQVLPPFDRITENGDATREC